MLKNLPMLVHRLELERYRRIVFLTGAGISVASGLRPYRGPNGLWQEEGMVRLSEAATLAQAPADVWKLFGAMREAALAAQPNPAHRAIAALAANANSDVTI